MNRSPVKLPESPTPMSPVRNHAVGFDIRASSFLRHWSFRHSSLRSLAGTTPGPKHHYLNLPRHNDRLARTVQVGSSEQVQYYHKNYLDHVYAITDEDGDALEHIRYCPRSKTRDDQRKGFACNEPLIAAKLSAFGLPTYYDFSGLKVATSPTGNPFLWNAKRLDPQLGWYVYHYRHYSPELGRWPSRDPIEEQGGVNLYGFVGNDPLNKWDKHGLRSIPAPGGCIPLRVSVIPVGRPCWKKVLIEVASGVYCPIPMRSTERCLQIIQCDPTGSFWMRAGMLTHCGPCL